MANYKNWIYGLFISLGLGHVTIEMFLAFFRWNICRKNPNCLFCQNISNCYFDSLTYNCRRSYKIDPNYPSKENFRDPGVPWVIVRDTGVPWVVGVIERIFFTLLIAYNVNGTPAAMIGWLAVKMASNWQKRENTEANLLYGFISLLAGLVSMTFAMIGGLIIEGNKIILSTGIKIFTIGVSIDLVILTLYLFYTFHRERKRKKINAGSLDTYSH